MSFGDTVLPVAPPAAVVAEALPAGVDAGVDPAGALAVVAAPPVVVAAPAVVAPPAVVLGAAGLVPAAVVLDDFESLPQAARANAAVIPTAVAVFQRVLIAVPPGRSRSRR